MEHLKAESFGRGVGVEKDMRKRFSHVPWTIAIMQEISGECLAQSPKICERQGPWVYVSFSIWLSFVMVLYYVDLGKISSG
jgi:hypothetical protein